METVTVNDLVVIVGKCNLPATKADDLVQAFGPTFADVQAVAESAAAIVVTDATQLTEMKAAREHRLKLRALRTGADKIRKELKEASLREGQGIQNVYNMIAGICEPIETRLEHAEKFAERAEAARKESLRKSRGEALAAFVPDVSIYPLGEMTDAAWGQLLDGSRSAYQARIDAAAKAEADRLAAIEAQRVEDARIRAENERLAAEAKAERERAAAVEAEARKQREEAEASARKAKADADALLAKERKEREDAEAKARAEQADAARKAKAEADAAIAKERAAREAAEAKAKAEAEEVARKERAAKLAEQQRIDAESKAKKLAESAPDFEKLTALAAAFAAVQIPALSSDGAKIIADSVRGMQQRMCEYIAKQVENLRK
jgi:hypothetical protein